MSHQHHHHPSDRQTSSDTLSLEEKLSRLFDHWIQHNDDHAKTYRDWGAKAKQQELDEIAHLLEEAAKITEKISVIFSTAAATLK